MKWQVLIEDCAGKTRHMTTRSLFESVHCHMHFTHILVQGSWCLTRDGGVKPQIVGLQVGKLANGSSLQKQSECPLKEELKLEIRSRRTACRGIQLDLPKMMLAGMPQHSSQRMLLQERSWLPVSLSLWTSSPASLTN